MKGLILDTSTKTAIIGVVEGGALQSTTLLDGGKGLSNTLFPTLEPLVKGLSYIAIGIGPGSSYMGLRTGATIAKTLAYALNIPLIEFSSLLVSLPPSLMGPFVFVGDAKMGQYYLIEGVASDGQIRDLSAPRLIEKANFQAEAPEEKEIVGLKPCPVHLGWVCPVVEESLTQKKPLYSQKLSLHYIR